MPITLHAATVPSMLQILGAAKGWLAKAAECGMAEGEVAEACLIEDMLPFSYQIKSMAVHSHGAFAGVRAGVFSPDFSEPPATLAGLLNRIEQAESYLSALTADEVEAMIGKDVRFEIGPKKLPFVAEDFLLTFSQPNFYFHATTAYGILRARGVKVGKLDYLGKLRLKG